MKIGIISMAHLHAFSYARCIRETEGLELAGIADEREREGREAAARFGTVWYRDYRELLAAGVDAVVICSENARHAEHAVAAAKAGKHILCEKPLAVTVEDGRAMIEAARENGVTLMTAFPCRFHPAAQRMKQSVASGRLGDILAIKGTNRGTMPGSWFVDKRLSGGGAVMDHTVHVLDLMRWIMPGAEAAEVYAEIDTRFHDIAIDDCGLLSIKFTNGVVATLDPSWSRTKSYPTWGNVTLEIVGTNGISRVDLFRQNLVLHDDRTMKTQWHNYGTDMDAEMVRAFVDSVRRGEAPPSPATTA